jgi:hypothetical protein
MVRRTLIILAAAFVVLAAGAAPVAAGERTTSRLERDIAALQKQVGRLARSVHGLEMRLTAEKRARTELAAEVRQLRANPVLDLGPYVRVVEDTLGGVRGPNVVLTGVNLHLRSGSGSTSDGSHDAETGEFTPGKLTGLGNLIVGYDEITPLHEDVRSGSHNLVLGDGNAFSSFGGLVAGRENLAGAPYASVLGGAFGIATGAYSVVGGGMANFASGEGASVTGGDHNEASGFGASVLGGYLNVAAGQQASVTGGAQNGAMSEGTVVNGGSKNLARGFATVVNGGFENVADGYESTICGGELLSIDVGWAAGWSGPSDEPWQPVLGHWFRTQPPE